MPFLTFSFVIGCAHSLSDSTMPFAFWVGARLNARSPVPVIPVPSSSWIWLCPMTPVAMPAS